MFWETGTLVGFLHHLFETTAQERRLPHRPKIEDLHTLSPQCQAGGLVPRGGRGTHLHRLNVLLGQGEEEKGV